MTWLEKAPRVLAVGGLTVALLLVGCGESVQEGVDVDAATGAAETPSETDAPGDPAVPETAVEEPGLDDPGIDEETGEVDDDPTDAVLTDQSQAEERQRSMCESQRVSHPGEDFRVECTRAVTGDDRAETYQCTCVWGG